MKRRSCKGKSGCSGKRSSNDEEIKTLQDVLMLLEGQLEIAQAMEQMKQVPPGVVFGLRCAYLTVKTKLGFLEK